MATIDLDALLHAAGNSLGTAQGTLMTGVAAPPTVMAIAEATLDMKVTVDGAARGALQVAPVSAADARAGAIEPAALSSVTMRFVAFGNDLPGPVASAATTDTPTRSPGTGATAPTPATPLTLDAATKAFQSRADIARRVAAGEKIRFDAVQTGEKDDAAWVVTARAPNGTTVAAASFAAKV